MDKTIKTLATILGGAVLALTGMEVLANNMPNAKNRIPPEIRTIDENHSIRLSYVYHKSLLRSASSWYDRVIEKYEKADDGNFKLTERITMDYHYPIFGLGGMTINEKTENFKRK